MEPRRSDSTQVVAMKMGDTGLQAGAVSATLGILLPIMINETKRELSVVINTDSSEKLQSEESCCL